MTQAPVQRPKGISPATRGPATATHAAKAKAAAEGKSCCGPGLRALCPLLSCASSTRWVAAGCESLHQGPYVHPRDGREERLGVPLPPFCSGCLAAALVVPERLSCNVPFIHGAPIQLLITNKVCLLMYFSEQAAPLWYCQPRTTAWGQPHWMSTSSGFHCCSAGARAAEGVLWPGSSGVAGG